MKAIVVLTAIAFLGISCATFVPPLGGENSYCYRIEVDRSYAADILMFTDEKPIVVANGVQVRNVYYAFYINDRTTALQFDRFADELLIPSWSTDGINVIQKPHGCERRSDA